MIFHNQKEYLLYRTHVLYIQPFSMEVDWPENWCQMEVSTICTYRLILPFYFVGQNKVGKDMWLVIQIILYFEHNMWVAMANSDDISLILPIMTRPKRRYHVHPIMHCSMGFFVQVVMWGDSDETRLKCKIWMSSVNLGEFITIAPHDHLTKIPLGAMHYGMDLISSLTRGYHAHIGP